MSQRPRRQCSMCGSTFSRQSALNRHFTSKHGDGIPRFKCPYCHDAFTRRDSLARHIQRGHQQSQVQDTIDQDAYQSLPQTPVLQLTQSPSFEGNTFWPGGHMSSPLDCQHAFSPGQESYLSPTAGSNVAPSPSVRFESPVSVRGQLFDISQGFGQLPGTAPQLLYATDDKSSQPMPTIELFPTINEPSPPPTSYCDDIVLNGCQQPPSPGVSSPEAFVEFSLADLHLQNLMELTSPFYRSSASAPPQASHPYYASTSYLNQHQPDHRPPMSHRHPHYQRYLEQLQAEQFVVPQLRAPTSAFTVNQFQQRTIPIQGGPVQYPAQSQLCGVQNAYQSGYLYTDTQ